MDTMGDGLEDKVALAGIGGMESEPMHLESSGVLMALPPSACAFQAYKVPRWPLCSAALVHLQMTAT